MYYKEYIFMLILVYLQYSEHFVNKCSCIKSFNVLYCSSVLCK